MFNNEPGPSARSSSSYFSTSTEKHNCPGPDVYIRNGEYGQRPRHPSIGLKRQFSTPKSHEYASTVLPTTHILWDSEVVGLYKRNGPGQMAFERLHEQARIYTQGRDTYRLVHGHRAPPYAEAHLPVARSNVSLNAIMKILLESIYPTRNSPCPSSSTENENLKI